MYRTIDLINERVFKLKNPETNEESIFLGYRNEASKDYTEWKSSNINHTKEKNFFWWCSTFLATK